MKRLIACLLAAGLILSAARLASAAAIPVDSAETQLWLRQVLPLPQQVAIAGKLELPRAHVTVSPAQGLGPAGLKAAAELKAKTSGAAEGQGAFTLTLALLGEDGKAAGIAVAAAEKLRTVPNKQQAYAIEPQGETGLLLTATTETGLYYAARTLGQLLEYNATTDTLSVPLVTVLDYPDLDERGVWNFPETAEWITWMASMKLNYGNTNGEVQKIERDKPNRIKANIALIDLGATMGLHLVPQIVHLNFLDDYGLFRAYPEMAGRGDRALAGRYFAHKWGPQHRVPNANDPNLVKVLKEWMLDLASQGLMDICCWLTERPATDERPETIAQGQFVLEARAFLEAWEEARKTYPQLEIRMFLSTVDDELYYRIYAEMPPDMKIFRCCTANKERVRHLPRDLFRDPLLEKYAQEGRWVGTYDVPLNVNGNVETPEFMTPHRSAHRINDYVTQLVERRYSAGVGMMAWDKGIEVCSFNIAALAEWGWNVDGRSTREFALAWATVNRVANPEALADWAELMGPVEFDVYDSKYPTCYSWGEFTKMVTTREQPVLGEEAFRYYRTPQSFDEKLATAQKALQIAEKLPDPDFANETRVVIGHIKLAKSIYRIAQMVSTEDLEKIANQDKLKAEAAELEAAGKETTEAIRAWRTHLGPQPWHHRIDDALAGVENTVKDINLYVKYSLIY
jgi:hypothetical protein